MFVGRSAFSHTFSTFSYSVKIETSAVLHTEPLAWMEGSPHKHFDSVLFHIRLASLDEDFQPAMRTNPSPANEEKVDI